MSQVLTENCRWYCGHRAELFEDMAKRNDNVHWCRLANSLGRPPKIWEYLESKLRIILHEKRSIGMAGWAWRGQGVLCQGFLRVWECTDKSQQSPYVDGEIFDWWPIIWLENGDIVVPMMCPALAWQNARPWSAHISRVWRSPEHWFHQDQYSLPPPPPPLHQHPPPPPPPPPPPSDEDSDDDDIVLLHDVSRRSVDDVAILEDVTESSEVLSAVLSTTSSESTAASSSSTVRRRRWGRCQKK